MYESLTLITLGTGIIFAVLGFIFRIFTPKKINSFYGYRTLSSKRNIDTWNVANKFSAKMMVFEGLVLIVIGFISFLLPDTGEIGAGIGGILILLSVIILIVATEKHLNKLFDKEGKRRL